MQETSTREDKMNEESGKEILTDLFLQLVKDANNVPKVRMQAAIGLGLLDRSMDSTDAKILSILVGP